MLNGKWIAEGKGKGRLFLRVRFSHSEGRRKVEYLAREPALKADCVVAQSEGDLGNARSIKGGTAGYKACPFKHSSVGRVFSRTGLLFCLRLRPAWHGASGAGRKRNLDVTGRQFKRKNLFIC